MLERFTIRHISDGITIVAEVTYTEAERRVYDIYGDLSNMPDYQQQVRFDNVVLITNGIEQAVGFGDLDTQTRLAMIRAAKLQGRVLCQQRFDAYIERRNSIRHFS